MRMVKKEKLEVFPREGAGMQKYNFKELDVGECYTFQGSESDLKRAQGAATSYCHRNDVVLRTMKSDGMLKVWRVK